MTPARDEADLVERVALALNIATKGEATDEGWLADIALAAIRVAGWEVYPKPPARKRPSREHIARLRETWWRNTAGHQPRSISHWGVFE